MDNITRWLDVEVGTDEVDLNTLPNNVLLVDLNNDNDYKLLIGDLGRAGEGPKLKVFKGTMQVSDMVLPDLPLGVASLYTSDIVPRTLPLVAVAFNTCIYVYRNMRLFYKYHLQAVEPTNCEVEAWKQLLDPLNQNPDAVSTITENLKSVPYRFLTMETRAFLSLSVEQQLEFLEHNPELPSKKATEIACIGTLKLNSVERSAACCLLVGTEDGNIIVLDSQSFTELSQAKLCSVKKTPYQIVSTGMYNVDYRITVATREKAVCILKREWTEGRILFTCDEHIIAVEVMSADNSVLVICADHTLVCYSKKGKKQWSIELEHRPVAMTLVPVSHLGVCVCGVALASGHVHLYTGKAHVDTFFVRDVVSVMKFGQLGQEEHVLIIVTGSGNLMLKILKRTADFNTHAAGVDYTNNGGVANKPWLIPKKSKLFIEQSVRERENAVAMHEVFQHELGRLRLRAARSLLQAHQRADNSVGAGNLESIRLTAEVEGLGPVFRVTLIIENTCSDKAAIGLAILFHVHTGSYKVSNPHIKVPLLSPGGKLQFPTKVEEVFEDNINPDVFFRPVTGQAGDRSLVKVLVIKDGLRRPVLAATVTMPPTDPMMLPFDKIQASAPENTWDNEIAQK